MNGTKVLLDCDTLYLGQKRERLMRVGVSKEIKNYECRAGLTPGGTAAL